MSAAETFTWDRESPFVLDITVGEADLDSYRHVNNSVYLRWIDDCARAHSKAVGIDCEEAVEFGFGMAVKESRAHYLASAYDGERLQVGAWVIHNDKRLRITRQFQIVRASDYKTLIRAEVDYVCINIHTGKASRMPREFQQLYVPCR